MDIKIVDRSEEVLAEMKSKAQQALEECGLAGEGFASALAPVDTGALRSSITHQVDGEKDCYIGTNSEYAVYVEMGTGIYAGGRPTPWVYQDAHGEWHRTNGQPPREFIKPAVADHAGDYNQIIESVMKG